jgi:histidinol-phosphate aminotransferase
LFVKSPIENLFEKLMERGVLIRKFKDEYYRITVGTKEENEIFIEELKRLF